MRDVVRRLVGAMILAAVAVLLALPASAFADDTETFTVNQTADTADAVSLNNACDVDLGTMGLQCTLRAAMQEQNDGDAATTDTIHFNLPANTTLGLASSLATAPVDENLVVDGCSGAMAPGAPCVGVRNTGAPQVILQVDDGTVTIKGLALSNATTAINAPTAAGFTLQNNYLGIRLDGATADANVTGATISADGATIGGIVAGTRNVFGNNTTAGLRGVSATGMTIQGNYFGVRPDGTTAAPNADDIELGGVGGDTATTTTIGGTLAGTACIGPCNVISNATIDGIDLQTDTADARTTTIKGNYIGLDLNGAAAADDVGINVRAANDTTIGGAAAGDRNYIDGIHQGVLGNSGPLNLDVRNNYLGLTPGGNTNIWAPGAGLGNATGINVGSQAGSPTEVRDNRITIIDSDEARSSILISGQNAQVTGNIMGVAVDGGQLFAGFTGIELNTGMGDHLISGNTIGNSSGQGIEILGVDRNTVTGNFIGTTSAGGSHPINTFGIRVEFAGPAPGNPSNSNVIGGASAADQNVISNVGFIPIGITSGGGSANEFRANVGTGNAIANPFIDLGANGVGNAGLNPPNAGILQPTVVTSDTLTATGTATAGAIVRLFSKPSSSLGDVDGFLGQAFADGAGNWQISHGAIPVGKLVAATQTVPPASAPSAGNTSELSSSVASVAAPIPPVLPDTDPPDTLLKKKPRKKSTDRTPTFKFGSDEPGSSFQCKLDRKRFAPCGAKTTFRVRPGAHKLQIESIDLAGNVDPTPATFKFKVLP